METVAYMQRPHQFFQEAVSMQQVPLCSYLSRHSTCSSPSPSLAGNCKSVSLILPALPGINHVPRASQVQSVTRENAQKSPACLSHPRES